MEVNEFAKFVIDNMHKATVGNALNIALKLDNPEYYAFDSFLIELEKYCTTILQDGFNKNKCYSIFTLINNTLNKYNSPIKYNKTFIINDFIIDLWRIMNEH